MRPALVLAALVSTAGGVVAHGIYFLAQHAYGFDDRANLWLAFVLFVPYIPAALLAGRLGRRVGPKRALHGLNTVMIAASVVLALRPPEWGLWLAAALYNGAAGALWPLIEGYVAGGAHGGRLHKAVGAFNLTWSATMPAALWIVALSQGSVPVSFGAVLVLHVVGAFAIATFAPAPQPHDAGSAGEVPPAYPALLWSSRILLPVSYVLLDALSPLLPGAWARAGVGGAWAAAGSSTWMIARFLLFVVLVRWSGWRGRPAALFVGVAALLLGFGAALGGGTAPVVLAGLVAFGVGQGTLYYGALYYGMAVEKGEVDSGGAHEAVIGLGYLGGPAIALGGLAVGVAPVHAVGALATLAAAAALGPWIARRATTTARE